MDRPFVLGASTFLLTAFLPALAGDALEPAGPDALVRLLAPIGEPEDVMGIDPETGQTVTLRDIASSLTAAMRARGIDLAAGPTAGPPPPVVVGNFSLIEFWVGFYMETYPSRACNDLALGPDTHAERGEPYTGDAPYPHSGVAFSSLAKHRHIRVAQTFDHVTGAVYDHTGHYVRYAGQGDFYCWIFEGFGNTFIFNLPQTHGAAYFLPFCPTLTCG